MKEKKIKKIFIMVLLATISILYVLFLYMDIFNLKSYISSNTLKYLSIILCFVIALFIGRDCFNKKDKILLQVGLFITVFADLCFLILDYYVFGVIFFCLIQIIYYIRYKRHNSYKILFIIIRFIIIFLFIMVIYFMINSFIIKVDFLIGIALFYSICIITSTIEAIQAFKDNLYPYPNKHMIFLGMILFLLCDINVAIYNLTKENFIVANDISSLLIWFFYLPSQVLLSTSGYKFN